MKILLDGYAMTTQKGTGLSRHAIETAGAIDALGHERGLLLGSPVSNLKDNLLPPAVFQYILAGNQTRLSKALLKAFPSITMKTAYHMLNLLGARGSTLRRLRYNKEMLQVDTDVDFNSFKDIYNSNDLFRCAFFWGALTGRNISVSLPNSEEKPDIFHCTSPVPIQLLNTPKVTTLHDIIPLTLPQSTQIPLRSYAQIMRASLRNCAMIFCISKQSAREAAMFFGIPEDRLAVTYQAVNMEKHQKQLHNSFVQSVISEHNLEMGGYLLFNGAIEPKKNVDRLLSAYIQSQVDLPLVVLGPGGWLHEATEARMKDLKKGKLRRIIRIKYQDRLSQLAIIRGARYLCFPSLAEGFGLPVLEAMSLGVPVITSQRPALLEVAGDAALTVDPKNTMALASAIQQLSKDNTACKELAERGLVQASKFSPQRYAERLEVAYARALGET